MAPKAPWSQAFLYLSIAVYISRRANFRFTSRCVRILPRATGIAITERISMMVNVTTSSTSVKPLWFLRFMPALLHVDGYLRAALRRLALGTLQDHVAGADDGCAARQGFESQIDQRSVAGNAGGPFLAQHPDGGWAAIVQHVLGGQGLLAVASPEPAAGDVGQADRLGVELDLDGSADDILGAIHLQRYGEAVGQAFFELGGIEPHRSRAGYGLRNAEAGFRRSRGGWA